jgi:hypothetical protein
MTEPIHSLKYGELDGLECAKNADALRRISFARFIEVLAFELVQALAFIGRQARPLAVIALGLAHPAT